MGPWNTGCIAVRARTAVQIQPGLPRGSACRRLWWKVQTRDTMARTFLYAVPIWTLWEVGFCGPLPKVWPDGNLTQNPLWLGAILLLVPFVHHVHFYLVHRLIPHALALCPGPCLAPQGHQSHAMVITLHASGRADPVFQRGRPASSDSGRTRFWRVPSALCRVWCGCWAYRFHTVEGPGQSGVDTHAFTHYLHHKYFEVNYGEGLVPIDKLDGHLARWQRRGRPADAGPPRPSQPGPAGRGGPQ